MRIATRPGIRSLLFCGFAIALGAPFAAAQDQADVRTLIRDLGADTLAAREEATQRLAEIEISLPALRTMGVDFESLSAEQRSRLDHVLLERFKRTPRAGLGVQYDPQFFQGVRLATVVDGFPASAVLQAGDIVSRVEGVDLNTFMSQEAWQALRHQILSFHPGETMDMVIRRGGQTLRVQVPLGSYADLGNAQPLTENDYAAAWSVRRHRLGVEMRSSDRIAAPRVAGVWSPMTPLDRARFEPQLGVIAGGSPGARPTITLEQMAQDARRQNVTTRIVVGAQQNARERPLAPGAAPAQANAEAMRTQLLRQIEQWEQQRARARQMAADPSLPAPQRSFWAEQLQVAEMNLAALAEALRQLDGR